MEANLYCKTGPLAGLKFEIDKEATIGFDPENTISLYPKTVSGRHARIYYDEDNKCYFLQDLNSRNGTFLNGVKITQKEKLDDLQVITFAGEFDFIFQLAEEQVEARAVIETAREPGPADDTPSGITQEDLLGHTVENKSEGAGAKTILDNNLFSVPSISEHPQAQETVFDQDSCQRQEVTLGAEEADKPPADKSPKQEQKPPEPGLLLKIESRNTTVPLRTGENVIGRASGCDIILDYASISRRHAIISITSNKTIIKDLGSTNHTFVEDQRIDSPVEIPPNTKIRLGDIEILLVHKE